jgi:hypothetical protein
MFSMMCARAVDGTCAQPDALPCGAALLLRTGVIPGLGTAMSAVAASTRSLVAGQQQHAIQPTQHAALLEHLDLCGAMLSAWEGLKCGVHSNCLLEPWQPTVLQYAALGAALLDALQLPAVRAAAAAAAAEGAAQARGQGARNAPRSTASSSGGSSVSTADWLDYLDRIMTVVTHAGVHLAINAGVVVDYQWMDHQHMLMLGSAEALRLIAVFAAETAQGLHEQCGSRSAVADLCSGSSSSRSGSGSNSRGRRQQQELVVPPHHLDLLLALHMHPAMQPRCARELRRARASARSRDRPTANLDRSAADPGTQLVLSALQLMLVGEDALAARPRPCGDPFRGVLNAPWPAPPLVPQQLLLLLMCVVMELLALASDATMLTALAAGVEVLQMLQPKLALRDVDPFLHVLGPTTVCCRPPSLDRRRPHPTCARCSATARCSTAC